MKVIVQGQNREVNLTQRDYLASGGQGAIYVRGDTTFKIFHKPADMIPVGKIQELAALTDSQIVRPQNVLLDTKGHPVGYTTRFVPNAIALCQVFPRSFREREGVTHDAVQGLIRKLQEGVVYVHSRKILVVDLNELNFLVSAGFDDVSFIDVDSYQTPHYTAPALMESVRDWTILHNQWSEASDWFSFGIVTFQMFTGIHPFKGGYTGSRADLRHKLSTDPDDDAFAVTRRRMQQNVSVFHPDVKCPGAIYPFSVIPPAYRAWYEALFAQGKRGAPPTDFRMIVVLPVAQPVTGPGTGSTALDIVEIGSYTGTVCRLWSDGSKLVVGTDHGVWLDKVQVLSTTATACGFSPRTGRAVVVEQGPTAPVLHNVTDRNDVAFSLVANEIASTNGRVYLRTVDQVHEVVFTDAGTQVIASTRLVVNVLPHATRLHEGVVVQNMLGSVYVSLLTQAGVARQIRIPELDASKIVEARFDGGVLMVITAQGGRYDRLVFRFAADDTYDVHRVPNILLTGLNFVTLDSGVCVCLNEEDKLEVFSSHKNSTAVRYIADPAIGNDMILGKMGGTLLAARGRRVYRLGMKA